MGRPCLPLGVCDVSLAGDVIAWFAAQFEEAPPILNLVDPRLMIRRQILRAFKDRGWKGRVVWIPISVIAAGIVACNTALAFTRFTWPARLAAWSARWWIWGRLNLLDYLQEPWSAC